MSQRSEASVGLVVSPAFGERGSFTPLGLAYLNGTLRSNDFNPTYIDLNESVREDNPGLHGRLVSLGFSPDVGGFFGPDLPLLCQVAQVDPETQPTPIAEEIIQDVKTRLETFEGMDVALLTLWDSNVSYVTALGCALRRLGVKVVIGGPGVTLEGLRKLLVALGAADVVVVGEGEGVVGPIIERFTSGQSLHGLEGMTWSSGAGQIETVDAGTPLRIHDIPEPSFKGFPQPEWIPILTSRGCIRDCSFCTEKFFWKRYRQRRVECVIAELETRIQETGITRFEFNDDLLNGHIRWLERFCDALEEKDLSIRWTCFMEPYRLSRELIARVAGAGCTLIKFGVQHFDTRMLKVIGRGTEVEDVVDTLAYAAECGIRVSFDLIPGHPGERQEHHETNLRVLLPLLKRSPLLEVNVNPFLLLHGSPVEAHPETYGVAIDRWRSEDFDEGLQSYVKEADGVFIRGYTQDPSLEVVRARTEELEALASMAQSTHGFVPHRIHEDRGYELTGSGESVCILPGPTDSPRDVLAAARELRGKGTRRLSIQVPPSALYREPFLKMARLEGVSHWVLYSEGEDSPEVLKESAAQLERGGFQWWMTTPLGSLNPEWTRTLKMLSTLGGYGLLLDGSTDALPWSHEHLLLATDLLGSLENPSRRVSVVGVPSCLLEGRVLNVLPSPLVASPEPSKRLVQLPVCRTCQLSPHCPGTTRARWEMPFVAPSPILGRPTHELPFQRNHEGWR